MKRTQTFHPRVAARRPWPVGPPLRGRASCRDAGMQATAHGPRSDPGMPVRQQLPLGAALHYQSGSVF
jgi:hypothetical protein